MEHFTLLFLNFGLVTYFVAVPSASGFSFTKKNSYLANHVMNTLSSKDWLECTLACQGNKMCISYNYNSMTRFCDLNEHGLQEPFSGPEELVKMQGVIFHQIRVSLQANSLPACVQSLVLCQ